MKKYKLLSIVFISVLLGSKCKEEKTTPITPYKPITVLKLDTLWTNSASNGITPIINGNFDVLMSSRYVSDKGEIFRLMDGNSGKIKWEWSDYIQPEEYFGNNSHLAFNDVMVLCARKRTYAFNILTGQTLWKHSMDSLSGEPQIYKDNDGYVYHGYGKRGTDPNYYIFRTKNNTGNWELICTFTDTSNLKNLSSANIGFANNNKGEKIMVFTILADNSSPNIKYSNILCGYNINTQKYEWIKDYTGQLGEFSVCKMQGSNGKVFTFAAKGANSSLLAFDVNNGNIAWQQQLPEYGTSLMLYKNSIVITSDYGSPIDKSFVISFEQSNGSKIWESAFVTENVIGKPQYQFDFEGHIIFKNYWFSTQCNNLLVLNIENGATVYNEAISLPNGCLQYGLAINEQKRCFYVQDRNKAICYKLPEEVKY